ncbi:hypothetical protein GA0061091_1503 [Gordonia sp. v-85]|nr:MULTISPECIES: enoyl-CoA hydratase [unclassified Gordonia (in: high G+C Gram-positive bacteria)]SCC61283.1 hypothetical protein GA0061091_1503 [Gordonia sp. v-85]
MKRAVLCVGATVLALASALSGVGQASAAPIPQVTFTGYNFGTFGDHSYCRGAINVTADSAPKKRGVVRVTARSHGFTGQGASWKRNPKCRVLRWNVYNSVRGINLEKFVTVSFGTRSGETKTWEIPSGSGPVSLGITAVAANSPIRVPSGYGSTIYMLVP